jgi:hypothetical protein
MCECSSSITFGKCPLDSFTGFMALIAPDCRFFCEGRNIAKASIPALLGQRRSRDFSHMEPATWAGCIVRLQFLCKFKSFVRW